MRKTKSKIVCLFAALMVLMLAAGITSADAKLDVSVVAQRGPAGAANLRVTMPDLGPAQLKSRPGGEVIQLGKLLQGGAPGDPMLPYASVRVLVPPDADLATAKAELVSGDWEDLPGEHDIAPAPPAAHTDADNPVISWGNKDKSVIVNGRDSTIYRANAYFPAETVQVVSVGLFRQWKLVEFKVWMAAYNPVQKKVRILKNAAATLSVERLSANLAVGLSSSTPPVLPGAAKYSSQLLDEVDNPQDLETFYGGSGGAPSLIPADYVIITTSTIVANSTKLASFIADKAPVYTVKTVVEGAVADDTHYVSGGSCDARANNIRDWLQSHYLGDGTEFVLLIGDPHPTTFSNATSIPMKMCQPDPSYSAPSDMYFAELSSGLDWDFEPDGLVGEYTDDYTNGACDKYCELKVGRVPFYGTYGDLDSILQKCIDYRNESGTLDWRKKALIPAAISNFGPEDHNNDGDAIDPGEWPDANYRVFGDTWGEAIKKVAHKVDFTSYTLYEKTGVYAGGSAYPLTACNAPLNKNNVINEWKNFYGVVDWWGHGSQTGAYQRRWLNDSSGPFPPDNITQFSQETSDIVFFQDTDCAQLYDDHPSFVFQISCNNAYPENSTNLAYSLLKQGAIGTLAGTRVTWYCVRPWTTYWASSYGENASYGYYGFLRMVGHDDTLAEALNYCRRNFGLGWGGASWMNMVDLTLYGDPSLSLATKTTKWIQMPDETQNGIDIRCDRSDGIPRTLADDFNCITTGPITKVSFWGSWKYDIKGQINMIHLSIHSNDPGPPSKPSGLLWEKDFFVFAGDFIETFYGTPYYGYEQTEEWFWDPVTGQQGRDYGIWQYDIYINPQDAFIQQGDPCNPITYWLDIWVDLEPDTNNPEFGWKTSYEHWEDDAVWWDDMMMTWEELRYPYWHPYEPNSIDLSFAITTGEEVEPNEPNDIKWSQPPVPYPQYPDTYIGWDEEAHDWLPRMVLDDFLCDSNKPITAIRWWGSFLGWYDDVIPYNELPRAFYLSIWDNVPAGADANYSHPGQMLWRTYCDVYDVSFYGMEYDPRYGYVDLPKFEFYQEIDPEEYWYQPNDVNVYWLGIMAIYGDLPYGPNYPWGWETRPHFFEDDAVRFFGWPEPNIIYSPWDFEPIEWQGETWDMSFELISYPRLPLKPLIEHSKWSQPPIEIDPGSEIPVYSGWDEPSFRENTIAMFPCWNIPRQCHGDADGLMEGNSKTGYYYVGNLDMTILSIAMGGVYPNPPYDHCADFNRDFIVDNTDQNILNTWFQVKEPPDGPGVPPNCPPEGGGGIWHLVADDFRCLGEMPVTSVHWWGSYEEWEEPGTMPAVLPIGWKICFWSNVPVDPTGDPNYSYPEVLLWQIDIDANRVEIDEVGTDSYHDFYPEDICYQYTLQLEPNEWFWQNDFDQDTIDNVFWLSIAAIYEPGIEYPEYPWGWKTRPWHWMDDAVRFWWEGPLDAGVVLDPYSVEPIEDPLYGESVDVAFELDTDPNYIKWEQHYTGIRDWPHYEDEVSMATVERWVEPIVKWQQEPDLSPTGLDVDVTEDIWRPQLLADDFLCDMTGPIDRIHIWGSWYHDYMPYDDPNAVEFTLSIHEDLPVGHPENPYPWSIPGQLLWVKTFWPGEFEAFEYEYLEEGWFVPCSDYYDPHADNICWMYMFPIRPGEEFYQEAGNIYWLDVQARPFYDPQWPEPLRFGWKNTPDYYHWNDDAVWAIGSEQNHGPWTEMRYPAGHPLAGGTVDLAFEIFTYGMTKWIQPPDMTSGTSIDIDATKDEIWQPQVLADDFECISTDPVTDIHVWGSWFHDYVPDPATLTFTLSIYEDIPADDPANPYGYSVPGAELWRRDFGPGEFVDSTYAQDLEEGYYVPCSEPPYYEPLGDTICFKYDFYIDEAEAFVQQGDPCNPVIYWLSVQTYIAPQAGGLVEPIRARFGWKTRDPNDHFMDDAVWSADYGQTWKEMRYPMGHPLEGQSVDLAFAITGGEEEHEELVLDRCVADDWLCERTTPVTAMVWWGSYLDYRFKPCSGEFMPLPVKPDYFDITIWTDVPARPPFEPFSHPNEIVWQYRAYDYDEVLVGYDKHPHADSCEVIEDFEDGDIAEYTILSGTHNVTAAAAHDGQYGLESECSNASWIYRDDAAVTVSQGDTISYWVNLQTDGRAYCGFGASANGTYSIVAAPNSDELLLQLNQNYDYLNIGTSPQTWTYDKWYRMEVEWGVGGNMTGRLYDSDGTTLLNTVVASDNTYTSGGIAFRAFDATEMDIPDYFDTVERCSSTSSAARELMASRLPGSTNVAKHDPADAIGSDADNGALIFPKTETKVNKSGTIADIRKQAMSAPVNVPNGPQKTNTGEERPIVFTGHVLSTDAPCATGACSSILYAPSEADNATFRSDLSTACGGATVDYYDASAGTPSVALLSTYDCVFTWCNMPYANSVAFGDNLADYVDAGGKVILGQWCYQSDQSYWLNGRIMTSAYCPVTVSTGYDHGSYNGDGTDCVHNGVTSYTANYLDRATLVPGNQSDGTFNNPSVSLAVAWRPDRKVYYSPGNEGYDGGSTGDWDILTCNMCCCDATVGREPVFRYSVRLPEDEWFYQEDVNNIYWLSVVAVYDENEPIYDWGWTNHEHVFNDDAAAYEMDPAGGSWSWVPLEDQTGQTEDMSFILFTVPECFPRCHPDYNEWVAVGKPDCWCYPRQCHGDSDDTKEYIKGKGYYYVHFNDLNLLLAAWSTLEPPAGPGIAWPDPNICADYGHDKEYIKGKGWYRVHFSDLNTLLPNWSIPEPPNGPGVDPNCLDCP